MTQNKVSPFSSLFSTFPSIPETLSQIDPPTFPPPSLFLPRELFAILGIFPARCSFSGNFLPLPFPPLLLTYVPLRSPFPPVPVSWKRCLFRFLSDHCVSPRPVPNLGSLHFLLSSPLPENLREIIPSRPPFLTTIIPASYPAAKFPVRNSSTLGGTTVATLPSALEHDKPLFFTSSFPPSGSSLSPLLPLFLPYPSSIVTKSCRSIAPDCQVPRIFDGHGFYKPHVPLSFSFLSLSRVEIVMAESSHDF